jgi:glycosyltransferase involved in cell wall biosynthesis
MASESDQLNVLYVSEYPPDKGAVSDYLYHMVKNMPETMNIDILSESGEQPDEDRQMENADVIGEVPDKKGWQELDLTKYDLIHFQYYVSGLREFFKYKITGGKTPETLITLHDVPKETKHKLLFTVFRNVILLTDETEKKFRNAHPLLTKILGHKVYRAPYLGIEKKLPEIVESKDIETELDSSDTNIVAPGFIHDKKGFHKVVEAFPDILKEYPDAKLTFAGGMHRDGDTEYLERIEKMIEESPVKEKINKTGVLPTEYHVYQYMKEADIVVLPFDEISQSASVTKTLAMGTPPIVTPLDTLKEPINNYGGKMIEEDNQKELKKGIKKALDNLPNVKSEKIREELSWQNNAEKHLEIYEDLIG